MQLQLEPFVLLHTIDADSGSPTSSAISWIYAVDRTTLRFAIDGRSRLVGEYGFESGSKRNVFAPGTVQTIYGTAKLAFGSIGRSTLQARMLRHRHRAIRDAMFYGARLSANTGV